MFKGNEKADWSLQHSGFQIGLYLESTVCFKNIYIATWGTTQEVPI